MKDQVSLNTLIGKVYGIPHYASTRQVQNVLITLDNHLKGKLQLTERPIRSREDEITYDKETNTGLLSIRGVLSNEESGWDSMCGITSYERLKGEFDLLVEKGINKLVLDIDSGGGEAYGCFETAMYVKNKAKENNIKIYSYVDGFAASAAYAWASIADEIHMNPAAEVGSIGVVIRLNKANAEDYTFVYAGDSKIPYDAEGNYSESFLSDLQDKVDFLYGDFVKHVAENRNLSIDVIKDTQAKTFMRDKAVSLGLVDKLTTKETFKGYIKSLTQETKNTMFENDKAAFADQVSKYELDIETLKTQLSDANLATQTLQASFTELQKLSDATTLEFETFKKQVSRDKREDALTAVLGTESDQIETYLTSFSQVDDSAFELLIAGLSTKKETVRETFKEVGTNSDAQPETYAQSLLARAKQTKTK